MPPSGDLEKTFRAAIDDFNNAHGVGSYQNFEQYLHPTDQILIQKVDDPGQFVYGDRSCIMNYLKREEEGVFPQFQPKDPLHKEQHKTKKRADLVGHVTGDGYYYDKYGDTTPIPVRYSLRFKNSDPNGQGIWLLVTANVAPI